MKIVIGFFAVVAVLVIILGFSGCASYNGLVRNKNAADTSWANVEAAYQRRADLIPNLVQTVQGAANFEKSTLEEVVKARAAATSIHVDASNPEQVKQFTDAQAGLSQSLGRLIATVENYPDLKSNANFLSLQAQLEGTENRINVARQDYNSAVQTYNVQTQSFPSVIFARMFGFMPRAQYQADPGSQNAPKVNFNFGQPATART